MTNNQDRWAIVRQVIIGSDDFEATGKAIRDTFGLTEGFADPLLEDIGMDDETIRVGTEAHLEVVAPLNDSAAINKWLAKVGGGGGYGLSIQVPDLAPALAAAAKAGIRVAVDLEAYGRRIIQFHPGDMGLLVELDEIDDPSVWFWDDIETRTPEAPVVDDVLAVEMSSADPMGQAVRWASIFGVEVDEWDDVPQFTLGNRQIRFVRGERKMLTAIDLAAVPSQSERTVEISGVTFRVVQR